MGCVLGPINASTPMPDKRLVQRMEPLHIKALENRPQLIDHPEGRRLSGPCAGIDGLNRIPHGSCTIWIDYPANFDRSMVIRLKPSKINGRSLM